MKLTFGRTSQDCLQILHGRGRSATNAGIKYYLVIDKMKSVFEMTLTDMYKLNKEKTRKVNRGGVHFVAGPELVSAGFWLYGCAPPGVQFRTFLNVKWPGIAGTCDRTGFVVTGIDATKIQYKRYRRTPKYERSGRLLWPT